MTIEDTTLPIASRIFDIYSTHSPEPLLVIFAGMHGNEPSGVYALQRVFQQLRADNILLNGQVMGVIGNQEALRRGVRYCNEDLNRLFLPEYIDQVMSIRSGHATEAKELLEICELVEACETKVRGFPFFVDCHTTSSTSIPYISMNEGFADSYHFAQHMPATTVIGVEKEIKGCLAEWLNRRGWHGFTFEAGQHQAAVAIRNQEAIIWLALVSSGCLSEHHAQSHIDRARETLYQQGDQQSKFYRVTSSYRIKEGENFRVEPGFINLQPIRKGQLLAVSDGQPLYASEDAHILMPLYQKQGDFGFFIAQEAN